MDLMPFRSILRGRIVRQLGATLLAAAFLLTASGELVGQHACPHQEASSPSAPEPTGADDPHSGHHHPPDDAEDPPRADRHDAHPDTEGDPSTGTGTDQGAHSHPDASHDSHEVPCLCVDTCHATPATPLPVLGLAAPVSAGLAPSQVILPATGEVRVDRLLLRSVLPFSTAPPRLD